MIDFFYVYSTLYRDLGVRLPFSDFEIGVLRELNVAPTQLHLNGRHLCKRLRLCLALAFTLTPAFFLYFFHANLHSNNS